MLLIVPAFYGLLTLSVLILAFGRHDPDARGAAVVLALLYVLTNVCQAFVHNPYNQFFPILDGATAAALVWFWRRRLQSWQIALVLLLLLDVAIHAVYFRGGDSRQPARYAYDLELNLIYIAQLVCVALGGSRKRRRYGGAYGS